MNENFSDASGAVFRKTDNSGEAAILRNTDQNTAADAFLKYQQAKAKSQTPKGKPDDIPEDWTPENRVVTTVMPEDVPQLSKELSDLKYEGGNLKFMHRSRQISDAQYQKAMEEHLQKKGTWTARASESYRDNQFRTTYGKEVSTKPDDYDKEDYSRLGTFGDSELGKRDRTIPQRLSDTRTEGYAGKGITTKESTVSWNNSDGTKTTKTVKQIDPYDLENRVQFLKGDDDKMKRALKKQFQEQAKDDPNGTINIPNGYDASGKEKYITKKNSEASYDDFLTSKVMNEVGAKLRTSQTSTVIPQAVKKKEWQIEGGTLSNDKNIIHYDRDSTGKEVITYSKKDAADNTIMSFEGSGAGGKAKVVTGRFQRMETNPSGAFDLIVMTKQPVKKKDDNGVLQTITVEKEVKVPYNPYNASKIENEYGANPFTVRAKITGTTEKKQGVTTGSMAGNRTVSKKYYSTSRNQTKFVYSDGTEEIKDGKK